MFQEIMPDLYQIEVPLPNSPLMAVNCYLVKGDGRFLLIDTGMDREECKREMLSSLKAIDVDLSLTDFFITHIHIDHLGLLPRLATENSKIYFNRQEASALDFQAHWQQLGAFFRLNGFPVAEMEKALAGHPGYTWQLNKNLSFCIVHESSEIDIGSFRFRCVETPGHSPGHLCLYEPDKKLLISGDHILADITPNITLWAREMNPLKDYMASLDKVYDLDIKLVLPAHGKLFSDYKKRVAELKRHHEERLDEVLSVLKSGPKNAYQVASLMTWEVEYDTWEEFPSFQKWFATGEALSHLRYLEEEGKIRSELKGKVLVYKLVESNS